MIEGVHGANNGGQFSARIFARVGIDRRASLGLPLAQLLLLSCP